MGKHMKVLFTGLGSIGRRHLQNLHEVAKKENIPLEVTALRSSNAPLAEDVRMLLKEEIQTLPSDEYYDAAFITGPTHLHKEVITSLKGRVDTFFIEKPIFHSGDIVLQDVGLDEGQKAYVAAPMRWTGVFMALEKQLKDMRPYAVRCICSSYLPEWRKNVDYRTVYSAVREMGGGVALDLIHEWDYLVQLFGFPQKVASFQGKFSHLEIDSDDLAVYLARYPNFVCEVHLDYFGREARRELEIFTENGTVKADFINGCLHLPNCEVQHLKEDANVRYLREMAYFLQYAKGTQTDSLNSPKRALEVLQLVQGE